MRVVCDETSLAERTLHVHCFAAQEISVSYAYLNRRTSAAAAARRNSHYEKLHLKGLQQEHEKWRPPEMALFDRLYIASCYPPVVTMHFTLTYYHLQAKVTASDHKELLDYDN